MPHTMRSAVNRVALRHLRAEFDFSLMDEDPKALSSSAVFLAREAATMDDESVAYGAYVTQGIMSTPEGLTAGFGVLRDALMMAYKDKLLSWFHFGLLNRANESPGKGSSVLASMLSDMVSDIPAALVENRLPVTKDHPEFIKFIDVGRLTPAIKKVMSVVQEDAHKAQVLEAPIAALRFAARAPAKPYVKPPMPPAVVRFDADNNVWYIVRQPAPGLADWADEIRALGWRWVDRQKRWERPTLPVSPLPSNFLVEQVGGPKKMTPTEAKQAVRDWFIGTWYPQNKDRLTKLFSQTIRAKGSLFLIEFKKFPSVSVKRALASLADAIEEIRFKYIGRQGREPWLETVEEVINLATATTPGQVMFLIDRLNNLQHSNGLFMEHFPPKVKQWYIPFLNAKYHAPTPILLARYIPDSDLRQFLQAAATWDEAHLQHSGWEDSREFRDMEKEKDPAAVAEGKKWRQLNYPYAPGVEKTKLQRDDPRVQEGLDELRGGPKPDPMKTMTDQVHQHMKDWDEFQRRYQQSKEDELRAKWERGEDADSYDTTWRGRQAALELIRLWGPTLI